MTRTEQIKQEMSLRSDIIPDKTHQDAYIAGAEWADNQDYLLDIARKIAEEADKYAQEHAHELALTKVLLNKK